VSILLHLLRSRGPGTPSDDTAPEITVGPASGSLTTSGATITWTTDEASDSQVEYGTTSGYGSASDLDSTKVTAHSVALSALSENTTYHYRVLSRDAAGNLVASDDATFTTTDATAPVITLVAGAETKEASGVAPSGASVTITWTTDELADSKVEYGTVASGAFGSATAVADTSPRVTSHSVTVTGLTGETAYQFRPVSRDATLNSATGSSVAVTTAWTPFLLSSLESWLQADKESFADASTTTTPTEWTGKSVGFVQNTAAQRPTYSTAAGAGAANGKACWNLDGTSDNFIKSADLNTLDLTGDYGVLIVFRTVSAQLDHLMVKYNADNSVAWQVRLTGTGAAAILNNGDGNTVHTTTATNFADGGNHALFFNRTGTDVVQFADGAQGDTFATMSTTASDGGCRIGCSPTGANLFTGDILAVMVFSDDLSAGDRTKLWAYLNPRMYTVPDVTAPAVSATAASETKVSTFVSGATVRVTWTTDEAGSSRVEYSTASDFSGSTTTAEADTSPRVTSHTVDITGLVENTTYYFRGKSKDASANDGVGSSVSLTTTWTPKALGAKVAYWADASLELTADQASVAAPTDWGPNGLVITQGTAGARPVFHAVGMDGAPCWRFDGVDDCWNLDDPDTLDLTTDMACALVFRSTGSVQAPIVGHYDLTPFTPRWQFGLSASGAAEMVTSGGGTDTGAFTGLNDGHNHALVWNRTTTSVVLSIDGAAHDTFTSVSNTAPNGRVRIGVDGAGTGSFYGGDLGLILLCNDDLTAGELDALWTYVS
jgi:hypothetical protein